MAAWRQMLRHDPLPVMLDSGDAALVWFARRDLLGERVPAISSAVWELPEVARLLRRQEPDGSFRYPGQRTAAWPPGPS